MGIIARDNNQLTLIYSSNTRVGTHTLSYLTSIDKPYLAIDLAHTKVGDTMWVEIAESIGCKVGDLVDKRELDMEPESTMEFGTNDWLKIIQANDAVISRPIAIQGDRTMQVNNPTEILEFFEVDSAGLDESPSDRKPDIERNNENENFIERNRE